MKNLFYLFLTIFLALSCSHRRVTQDYYSLEKSYLPNFYGKCSGSFNFYKFQRYLASVVKDSVNLDKYYNNFGDSAIYQFLKNTYQIQGHNWQIANLGRIGALNLSCPYPPDDSTIIVLDLYEDISLIALSPAFTIYPLGSCCSPYQNLLIQQSADSIAIIAELHLARLLGVYLDKEGVISGLLFQGYSNGYYDFAGLNSTYNFVYSLSEQGINCASIENCRNGEPFDKNDKYKDINDFKIVPVKFPQKHKQRKYER